MSANQDSNVEVQALKLECERLRWETETLREQVSKLSTGSDALAHAKLEISANRLSKDIKTDFIESVKKLLWVLAIVFAIATGGGLLTLSDLLKNRIDATIESKSEDIDRLRGTILSSYVDIRVKAEAANKEIDNIKIELETTKQTLARMKSQVEKEGSEAIASIRGVLVTVTSQAGKPGQTATRITEFTRPSLTQPPNRTQEPNDWAGVGGLQQVSVFGSSFGQVGFEEKDGGDFSQALQRAILSEKTDKDGDGVISIREITTSAASTLTRQSPQIFGQNQDFGLLSVRPNLKADRPKRRLVAVLSRPCRMRFPVLGGPGGAVLRRANGIPPTLHGALVAISPSPFGPGDDFGRILMA